MQPIRRTYKKRRIILNAIASETVVNDIHSQLNSTAVHEIIQPTTLSEIQAAVVAAAAEGRAMSIAAGRHAMGGQQFGEGTVLLDMNGFKQVIEFDAEAGIVEVEAGI